MALGTANIVGSLFSSFAVAGAFGRSAVNSSVGARSQVALFSSTVFLAVLMLFVQASPTTVLTPDTSLTCR